MRTIKLLFVMMLATFVANAQVTGTKNIPGDYATLAAAIADLNAVGVGAGGATININAPQTATAVYVIGSAVLNASTSAANPLVINGGGNVITPYTGVSTTVDAVFEVAGTDYVTLNQINIVENPTNTTTTTQMEFGIALMAFSNTDACNFVTVQNCTINLNGAAQVNINEVGIYVTMQLFTTTSAYATMGSPLSQSGVFDNITIRANTINNCYHGIVAGSSTNTTLISTNVRIGGTTPADGNTITNFGSMTAANTGVGYGIYCNYVGGNYISNNSITGTGMFGASYGIYDYYSPGQSVVSRNTIQLTTATGTQAMYPIYHYNFNSVATIQRTDSNTVQNCSMAGTGIFYGIYSYMYYAIGATPRHYLRNNVLTNFTRTGLSGTFYGIYRYSWANTSPVLDVQYLNNTISNINMPSMGGTQSFYGHYHVGYTGGTYRGNRITNVNINNGASTSAQTFYLQYFYNYSGQAVNWIVDSNEVSKFRFTGAACTVFAAWAASGSPNQFHYSRNRHDSIGIVGGATTANVEGGFFISTNSGGPVYVYNNNISNLYATAAVADNAIKGSDITAGSATTNFFWNNTINIGANGLIGSTGANFGVTGLAFTVPVNVRNNIIRVNATPNGLGYTTAIRGIFAGTAGVIGTNFAAGSSNNILWVPTGTNRNLYAENALTTAPNVFYNLTNDPNFNTSCGLFKAVAGARGFGTFTENNLTQLPSGLYAPTGLTYAESNAVTIPQVTNDINGVARPAFPDCGAVEFAGTALDANPPSISFTPITSSSYCGTLPVISATITDVSGVNTASGTKPRIYFKKSTDANALVGNTSADNGWKWAEATNAASPFTFQINPALLQTPPTVGDAIQYFIVAQDNALTPNVGGVTVAFSNCPTSVALTSTSFPTLAAPASSSMSITAPPPLVISPSANPTTACNGGSVTLTAADTISLPGVFPSGYLGPYATGTADDEIWRVQIVGTALNNSSTCATTGGGAANNLPASILMRYSNYTSTVAPTTLVAGQPYTMNVDLSNCGTFAYSMGLSVFIDFNRNGVFDMPQERVFGSPATILGGLTPGFTTTSLTFTIPTTGIVNGPTLMRVYVAESVAGNTHTPATTTSYGEAEDYWVNINTPNATFVNTLANSQFNWTPSANIVTNPNRTVTATNITSTTTYTVTAADGGGCTVTASILVPLAVPVTATGVTGTTTYCSATPNTTLTVQTSGGSTPINSFWLGGPVVGSTTASCLTMNGFTGSLAPGNWTTLQFNSNGTVNTAGAPSTVVMTSGNNASGTPGTTQFSYVSSCAGTVSFNWNYTTVHGAAYDYPQYQINSNTPVLFNGYNTAAGIVQSGTQTISVAVGDTVKLQTYTTNNLFGACTVTINNFSAPGLAGMINGKTATLNPPVGTTTYTVIAMDACGTTSSTTVTVTVNPTPSLTMTPGTVSMCAGASVTEVASGSGAATVYTWMPGSLTGTTQVFSPTATTVYTVTATDGPCSTTTAYTITYVPLPVISSTNANPANVCNPGTTVLSCTDTINGPVGLPVALSAYGASNATSTADDDLFGVTITGTTLNNTSNCGTIAPGPGSLAAQYSNYTVGFPATSLNVGQTYSGTLCLSNCSGYAYAMGQAVFIDLNRNGVFDMPQERVFASGGTVTGGVSPACISTPILFTIPATAVPGQTLMRIIVTESVAGTSINPTGTYTWGETEDYIVTLRKSSGLPNSSFVWSGPATFTGNPGKTVTASNILNSSVYTITATDLVGCSTTSTISVNMATPILVTSITGTTTYCSATPNTTLTVNTLNGSTPFTAVWTGGPVVSTNGLSATLNPPVGTTTYTVTVTDACGTASTSSVTVTVNPTPTVAVSPGTVNLCATSVSTQTASGSGAVPVYNWMPGSLVGPTQGLSPSNTTVYTVTATDGPCSNTTTLTINVIQLPVISTTSITPIDLCSPASAVLTCTDTINGPVGLPVALTAYGTSNATSNMDDDLFGVTITGTTLNNTSNCGTIAPGPGSIAAQYSNYTVGFPATSLNVGQTYSGTLCLSNCSGVAYSMGQAVFIDLNRNGVFDMPQERVFASASTLAGGISPACVSTPISFTIPSTAVAGQTLMRIIVTESVAGTSINPTGTYSWGETEDYIVTLRKSSGLPNTAFVWSGPATFTGNPGKTVTATNVMSTSVFTVTATDANGCTGTNTVNMVLKPTVTGTVNAAPSSYCVGGNSLLNGTMPVVCGPNQANFTAYYAPATWTFSQDNANGSVNTASAPASISLTSGTNSSFIEGFTNYRHTFGCSGNVTFNWSYNSADLSYSDRPRYRVNSNVEQDFPGFNQFVFATPQSGTATIAVNAGDTLTLQMYTTDNDGIPGTVTISNWSAPAEPVNGFINYWSAPTGGTLLSTSPYLVAPTVTTTYYAQYNTLSTLACTNPVRVPVVVTVNQLPVMSASASPNPVCFGSPSVLTGTGASTYSWHPGALTGAPTVYPSTTTTYTVTGIDANGCSNTASLTLAVNTLPTVSASASNTVICNGQTSTLTGNGAVTYSWMPGNLSGSPVVSPTVTTTYTMTGTDANGCNSTATVQVVVNQLPNVQANASPATICQNVSSSLTATGATSYSWTPGTLTGATVSVTPMSTTIYTVTGTDGNGCTKTSTTTVNVNVLPTVTASNNASPICFGYSSGLSGTGGVSYAWQPGNLSGAPTVTPANTTTYTMTATDANGCTNTATTQIVVNQLSPVTITPTLSTICFGENTTLNVSGASTYAWQPGNLTGSPTVSPATTTVYTVTGTDINGCNSTATVQINVNQLPIVIANAAPTTICQNVSSSLNASGANTYTWTPGSLSGATVSVTPMSTTIYTVTGTDGNGCSNTTTTTVNVNVLPTVTASNSASPICFGFSSGLSGTGGISYAWQPGNLTGTPTVSPTSTTTYTMTATDANGCTNTTTTQVVVNQLPPIVITPTLSAICLGFNSTLNVSGASTYTWQPGNLTGSPTVSPSTQTTYTVTGTDVNGCVSTSSVTIGVYLLPTITATASPSTICNGFSSTLTGNGGATYSWQPGNLSGAPVVSPNANTTYTVVGTDAAGCSNTTTVAITVLTPPSVFASGPANAFCQGGSAIIAGFSIPSIPSGSFVWQPGNLVGATKNVSPTTTTVYTVTATAANGCTGTATWNVQINPKPVMSITASPSAAVCMSTPQVTLTANGANTYSWTGGITNGNAFNASLGTTTYTVTGTSVAGCTSTTSTSVTGNANPTVAVSATPSILCTGNTAVLTATGNGASYSWTNGANTAQTTVQPASLATYTVTSTSAAGCTNTTSVSVNVTTGIYGLATTSSADTNSQPDGSTVTYTNSTCNMIMAITDNVGGSSLGNTIAIMTITPTVQSYNGQPYLNRWYQITPQNNIAATLKFYVNQFDFDMYNAYATANNWPLLPTGPADANGIANVRVTKVTNAGLGNNPVVLTPSSVTWNATYGYWEIITSTPSFSQFYIHAANPNNTPLPATITRFDGRKLDNSNRLDWTTVSEQNNSHFTLQYSTDGTNFTDLAKIDSKAPNGNSNDVLNYTFDHTSPALGHNYYRLQQVDIDGKKSYHANVVDLIWASNGSTVSVYPNPSQGVVNIDLYTVKAQNTNIKVLDMSGRIVKQIEARSEAGMNKLSVDLGDVAQGIYTLQVFENGQMTFVERVRKTN